MLVPPAEVDPAALADAIGNYDVARWLGRVPYPYRVEDAVAYQEASRARAGRIWLALAGGSLAGGVSVDGELGYWLARPAWGRGFATEAAAAAVDVHFADPDAPDLRSGHFAGNARSARVLAKLGFRPDGRSRVRALALSQDVLRHDMRLTRADWAAARAARAGRAAEGGTGDGAPGDR